MYKCHFKKIHVSTACTSVLDTNIAMHHLNFKHTGCY